MVADEDGRGFAVVSDDGRRSGPYAYVESGRAAETQFEVQRDGATERLQRRGDAPTGAVDVAVAGDRVAVVFRRPGEHSRRIIDLYDLAGGTYRESYVFPSRIRWIAWFDGTFFVLHDRDDAPALNAVRPRVAQRR